MTGAFDLEKLLDFRIILAKPVSVLLVERPPPFSTVFRRMVSAAPTCTRDLYLGLAVPRFLVWPGAPLETQFSSPASFFTCAPLFLVTGFILSLTLVRTSL